MTDSRLVNSFWLLALLLIASIVVAGWQWRTADECVVTWQASSIEVVNGVQSEPAVSDNCNPEGDR